MYIDIYNTENKYDIIYADPAWTYTNVVKNNPKKWGSAQSHYVCSSNNEMKSMPIKEISNKNSVLIMWVTAPCLEEGLDLMKSWGFQYKTVLFTWAKQNRISDSWQFGMGHYTRPNTEFCLFGVKGKGIKVKSHSVRQLIVSHVRDHSRKPDEARERIVNLFGDIPRIELFARESADGWDCYGYEAPKE